MQSMKGASRLRENKSDEKWKVGGQESYLWGDDMRALLWMGRENAITIA